MDEVIYFVSDTHLGDGSGSDRFRYPDPLAGLLARIEAEPRAHLVLLGDFMELWASSLEPIMIRHAPILNQVGRIAAKHPVTYVTGNHDCIPWYYFVNQSAGNLRVAEKFVAARGALVAVHGHQYDPFNKVSLADGQVKAPWTRRLVQVVGFLERLGGDATADALTDAGAAIEKAVASLDSLLPDWDEPNRRTMGSLLTHTRQLLERESPGERGYPQGERQYEEAARSMLRTGARFVVMGHTHHPVVHTYGAKMYVNTGSWVWDRYPPTYARFAGGQLSLIDANTHQPYQPT